MIKFTISYKKKTSFANALSMINKIIPFYPTSQAPLKRSEAKMINLLFLSLMLKAKMIN